MPASEEWRCHTTRESELAPTTQLIGTPFQNSSSALMHIRRVDSDFSIEQGSPDDAAVLEVKKDSGLAVANESKIRIMRNLISCPDLAVNTHGQKSQKSWVFPRGALTLEENESMYAALIIRNSATGEKYAGDVTFWYHY